MVGSGQDVGTMKLVQVGGSSLAGTSHTPVGASRPCRGWMLGATRGRVPGICGVSAACAVESKRGRPLCLPGPWQPMGKVAPSVGSDVGGGGGRWTRRRALGCADRPAPPRVTGGLGRAAPLPRARMGALSSSRSAHRMRPVLRGLPEAAVVCVRRPSGIAAAARSRSRTRAATARPTAHCPHGTRHRRLFAANDGRRW